MNTQHTSGEWIAHNNNISDFYDIDCDGNRIASVSAIPEHKDGVPLEEKIANARLIAAAPDLLEALQQLVNTDKNNADHFHRAICDAERAILKATTPTDHKQ